MRFIPKDLSVNVLPNGKIGLTFNTYHGIKQELLNLSGEVEIVIRKPTKKRSLNQNNLLWELIGQIDIAENGNRANDVEIYCNLLRSVGARVEVIAIEEDAADEFIRMSRDLFREVVIVRKWQNSKGVPWVQLNCYYGSSKMSTQEMNLVIDKAIEYANELGIDTEYWRDQLREQH